MAKRAQDLVYNFLDTNGDGTGTTNANGNYAISPNVNTQFYYEATEFVEIHRLMVHIQDTAGIDAEEYGNLGAALTNGYSIKILDSSDNEIIDLCHSNPIKSNGGIARYCHDVELKSWGTTPSNEVINARWTFSKAGSPIVLQPGWKFSTIFSDNLTGLLQHYFMIQGTMERSLYKYD